MKSLLAALSLLVVVAAASATVSRCFACNGPCKTDLGRSTPCKNANTCFVTVACKTSFAFIRFNLMQMKIFCVAPPWRVCQRTSNRVRKSYFPRCPVSVRFWALNRLVLRQVLYNYATTIACMIVSWQAFIPVNRHMCVGHIRQPIDWKVEHKNTWETLLLVAGTGSAVL